MYNRSPRVAWRDWNEWRETYSLLFSPHPSDISVGVSRVSAWDSKQNLPIAVEVTASLLRGLISGEVGRDSLSLSLIRFINGVVEPFKDANLSVSISTISASLHVPDFLVSLRHQATHGRLPTLELAVIGAQAALRWLKENYWEEQARKIDEIEKTLHQQVIDFLLNGSTRFFDNEVDILCSFGVGQVTAVLLNENQKFDKISMPLVEKVCLLIDSATKNARYFQNALVYRLAEEAARGNKVAARWICFIVKKRKLSLRNVALIFQWADPSVLGELGEAMPLELINDINPHVQQNMVIDEMEKQNIINNIHLDKPNWPQVSIGSMPVYNESLTLTEDEFEFVEPGKYDDVVDVQVTSKAKDECVNKKMVKNEENILEIW